MRGITGICGNLEFFILKSCVGIVGIPGISGIFRILRDVGG